MYNILIKHKGLSFSFVIRVYEQRIYNIINSVFRNWTVLYDENMATQCFIIEVYDKSIVIKNKNESEEIAISGIEHLIYIIIDIISEPYKAVRCNGLAFYHGGVVAKENECMLIIAPTMQGKTTLCTKLSLLGYTYISDDLIVVDNDMNVYSLPAPIKIRKNTVLEKEQLLSNYSVYETNEYSILTPNNNFDSSLVYSPKKALFLSRHTQTNGVFINKLSPFEAVKRFIVNGVYIHDVHSHLTISKRLSEECMCYEVYYNHIQEIIDGLRL